MTTPMDAFTPWTLILDAGLISALLLLGKLLRAKVRFIQKLFIPPSLLAGFMALLLGPEVLGWIPLSDNCGTYSGILIALVFACIPLTSKKKDGGRGDGVGRMWAYSNSGMLFQWALGGALGIWVFSRFFPVDEGFGITMPAGFCGGHGTAAALGDSFGSRDIMTIAMTSATVGIIAAVVVGLALIKWGTNHGKTSFISKYSDLPDELRTGILPPDKQEIMGHASFSAISLDSLTFNLGTILLSVVGGFGISKLISHLWPALVFPVFICAFLVGLLVRFIFDRTKASRYLSSTMISHMSGTCTDYLVAFGVASIKLNVVWELIVPISLLFGAGLVLTFLFVYFVGRKLAGDYWFEKAVFTWGWFTGTMSMSIALLRIVDPDMKTGTIDEYAFAYIYVAPVEIALISLAPIAFLNGYGVLYVVVSALAGVATLVIAKVRKWL